jgi:hypothetical protein
MRSNLVTKYWINTVSRKHVNSHNRQWQVSKSSSMQVRLLQTLEPSRSVRLGSMPGARTDDLSGLAQQTSV